MSYSDDPNLRRTLQVYDAHRQQTARQAQIALDIAIDKWKEGENDYDVALKLSEGFLNTSSEIEEKMLRALGKEVR